MIKVTENIILKNISFDDVDNIFNIINMQRGYLRTWLPFVDSTMQRSDTFNYVQSVIEQNGIQYSIYENNTFLGLVGFNSIDRLNKKAEIGYWLSKEAQGKGIITNSVKEICIFGFTELGLNRIQIKVATENTKSRSIPEKLNFRFEGIELDGELLIDNKFTDLAIYALLKKDIKL